PSCSPLRFQAVQRNPSSTKVPFLRLPSCSEGAIFLPSVGSLLYYSQAIAICLKGNFLSPASCQAKHILLLLLSYSGSPIFS
ncbi:hypothetical protein LEMLEM_LOCUS10343, partial [Lemmus lemmus]